MRNYKSLNISQHIQHQIPRSTEDRWDCFIPIQHVETCPHRILFVYAVISHPPQPLGGSTSTPIVISFNPPTAWYHKACPYWYHEGIHICAKLCSYHRRPSGPKSVSSPWRCRIQNSSISMTHNSRPLSAHWIWVMGPTFGPIIMAMALSSPSYGRASWPYSVRHLLSSRIRYQSPIWASVPAPRGT